MAFENLKKATASCSSSEANEKAGSSKVEVASARSSFGLNMKKASAIPVSQAVTAQNTVEVKSLGLGLKKPSLTVADSIKSDNASLMKKADPYAKNPEENKTISNVESIQGLGKSSHTHYNPIIESVSSYDPTRGSGDFNKKELQPTNKETIFLSEEELSKFGFSTRRPSDDKDIFDIRKDFCCLDVLNNKQISDFGDRFVNEINNVKRQITEKLASKVIVEVDQLFSSVVEDVHNFFVEKNKKGLISKIFSSFNESEYIAKVESKALSLKQADQNFGKNLSECVVLKEKISKNHSKFEILIFICNKYLSEMVDPSLASIASKVDSYLLNGNQPPLDLVNLGNELETSKSRLLQKIDTFTKLKLSLEQLVLKFNSILPNLYAVHDKIEFLLQSEIPEWKLAISAGNSFSLSSSKLDISNLVKI